MEDLEHEVTVSPLPTAEEAAVAAQSIVVGGRTGPAMAILFATPAGRMAGGYRASLVARVHLRLGMWRWSISEASKACTCCPPLIPKILFRSKFQTATLAILLACLYSASCKVRGTLALMESSCISCHL